MMEKAIKKSRTQTINSIIGVAIMFLFPMLPIELIGITDTGMEVIGIFIGTIYLWSTVDSLWASLIAVGMLGISSYSTMSAVMSSLMGNTTAMTMFFIMVFTGALTHNKVTVYVVRSILKIKFANGKPWLITGIIVTGAYLVSAFISPPAAIFLFWAILYDVFKESGYKKGDAYVTLSLLLVGTMGILGSGVAPYRGVKLALFATWNTYTEGASEILSGPYLAFALPLGFLIMLAMILVCKFILKPDVSRLQNLTMEQIDKKQLPPMSKKQKILGIAFFILICLLLFPSILTSIPFMSTLNGYSSGIPMIMVAILCAIKVDHKPVLDFQEVISNKFAWSVYFLCCVAVMFGTALTSDATGVQVLLESTLSPMLSGFSPTIFVVVATMIACCLTNVLNNTIISLLFVPVVATYITGTGLDGAQFLTVISFSVTATAFMTPAASPYTALMYANEEWMNKKEVYKYTPILTLVSLVVLLIVGVPLSNWIFA